MANDKISTYLIQLTQLPSDFDLMDVSVLISTDPDVWETRSVPYSLMKGTDIIAFKLGVDTAILGVVALDWNCSGKRVIPSRVEIINTAASKGLGNLTIQIQRNAEIGNVLPAELINAIVVDGSYILPIMGAIPEILSDSDTINLEIVIESDSPTTHDIIVYGTHQDV